MICSKLNVWQLVWPMCCHSLVLVSPSSNFGTLSSMSRAISASTTCWPWRTHGSCACTHRYEYHFIAGPHALHSSTKGLCSLHALSNFGRSDATLTLLIEVGTTVSSADLTCFQAPLVAMLTSFWLFFIFRIAQSLYFPHFSKCDFQTVGNSSRLLVLTLLQQRPRSSMSTIAIFAVTWAFLSTWALAQGSVHHCNIHRTHSFTTDQSEQGVHWAAARWFLQVLRSRFQLQGRCRVDSPRPLPDQGAFFTV